MYPSFWNWIERIEWCCCCREIRIKIKFKFHPLILTQGLFVIKIKSTTKLTTIITFRILILFYFIPTIRSFIAHICIFISTHCIPASQQGYKFAIFYFSTFSISIMISCCCTVDSDMNNYTLLLPFVFFCGIFLSFLSVFSTFSFVFSTFSFCYYIHPVIHPSIHSYDAILNGHIRSRYTYLLSYAISARIMTTVRPFTFILPFNAFHHIMRIISWKGHTLSWW